MGLEQKVNANDENNLRRGQEGAAALVGANTEST